MFLVLREHLLLDSFYFEIGLRKEFLEAVQRVKYKFLELFELIPQLY